MRRNSLVAAASSCEKGARVFGFTLTNFPGLDIKGMALNRQKKEGDMSGATTTTVDDDIPSVCTRRKKPPISFLDVFSDAVVVFFFTPCWEVSVLGGGQSLHWNVDGWKYSGRDGWEEGHIAHSCGIRAGGGRPSGFENTKGFPGEPKLFSVCNNSPTTLH